MNQYTLLILNLLKSNQLNNLKAYLYNKHYALHIYSVHVHSVYQIKEHPCYINNSVAD